MRPRPSVPEDFLPGFASETILMVAVLDHDLNIRHANLSWRRVLPAEGALREAVSPALAEAVAEGRPLLSPVRLERVGGGAVWVRLLTARTGTPITVVLADATEEARSLEAAEDARHARDQLLSDAAVGTWLYDPDLDVYDFSPELLHLTPIAKRVVEGRRLGRIPRTVMDGLYHPEDLLRSRPLRERIVHEGGSGSLELRLRNRAGVGWDHLRVMMRSGRRRESGLFEMYGLSQVVTELAQARDEARQSAERVQALAATDALTGLSNRLTFDSRMQAAASAARRGRTDYAVLYIDLDHFKQVNDTLGHQAGDELICQVAARLSALARPEDTVARLGGDEFAVIQHGGGPAGAAALAGRVVRTLHGAVRLGAGEVGLSCSVGVALIDAETADRDEALRQADLALYRAKSLGRGCFCIYEPEMDAALKSRKALEVDLRQAIERDEIRTFYQPLVTGDGTIVAVEALSRWTHPERGPIAPSVFIPLAEETDLISPLAQATFRHICLDAARWPALPVAVNMSAKQLRKPGFLDGVTGVLTETGTDPSRFEFELTESCVLDDDAHTQQVLRDLRNLGFRLALDDFGTGYSSLSYLQKYPIDKIKLDRSFILRLREGKQARAVVNTIVQLADALSLELVAEGVETRDQLDLLRDMGVTLFQGYLFSPPVDRSGFENLLAAQNAIHPVLSGAGAA